MQTSNKILYKAIALIKYFLLILAILFVLIVAGVNLPFVQKFISDKANEFFISKNLPVSFERLSLLIDGRIGLTKPLITINETDTVIYAENIKISVKVLPLVLKKIRVGNVTVHNAVVNLETDIISGKLNLVSLFAKEKPVSGQDKKSGKLPDLGVNNINLKNIRFTFRNGRNGMILRQNVGRLNVSVDRFSLNDKEISADYIDLKQVTGGLVLYTSSPDEVTSLNEKAPADWKFKLGKGDLQEIKFILDQPESQEKMEFMIGNCDIADAGFELAGNKISVNRLLINEPEVIINSSQKSELKVKSAEEVSTPGFPGPWIISGNKIKISDGKFHTSDKMDSLSSGGKSELFRVTSLNTSINDLKISGTESGFDLNELSVKLNNGFALEKGNILFLSDSSGQNLLKVNLMTAASRINAKIETKGGLSELPGSWKSTPFILEIEDTGISTDDILAFFPANEEKKEWNKREKLSLSLSSKITGSVNNLNINNFILNTSSGTGFNFSGQVMNLTYPGSAMIAADFRAGPFTSQRLKEITDISGSDVRFPEFDSLTLEGKINGGLTSQEFMVHVQSNSGIIKAAGKVGLKEKIYQAELNFSEVELGTLTGIKDLGILSGSMQVSGKEFDPLIMTLKSKISIDTAFFKEYEYHKIRVDADGTAGSFTYSLISDDPNAAFNFNGTLDLKKSSFEGVLSGKFGIDAGKINVYKGIAANGKLQAELQKSENNLRLSVSMNDLIVSNLYAKEELRKLTFGINSSDSLLSGIIDMDFMKAEFSFDSSIDELGEIFSKNRSKGLYLVDSTMNNRIPYVSLLPRMNISVEAVYDPILNLFVNDTIFSYDRLALKIIKDTNDITSADLDLNRFNLGPAGGFGTLMHFAGHPDSSMLQIKSDSITYGKISLTGLEAGLLADNDTLLYKLSAGSKKGIMVYDIAGAAYKGENHVNLIPLNSEWIINGYRWNVEPDVFLTLEPRNNDLTADLHLKNGQNSIDITGRKSEKILLELKNIWLAMLLIPGMNTSGYDGEFNGTINYTGINGMDLGMDIDISQMKISDRIMGNMNVSGNLLADSTGNINGEIKTILNDSSRLSLMINNKKSGRKSLQTEFSEIPLEMLESFVKKYISGLKGEVSGDLSISSDGKEPEINGKIEIEKTEMKIIPLNARFYLPDDIIRLKDNQIIFSDFNVLDSLRKQLSLSGTIDLKDRDNITADLQITSDHLQVMNTTARENPEFNGSVFIDSRLNIKGPVQKPEISGKVVLAEGTMVNYKLTENLNVSETEKTITFTSFDEETDDKEKVIRNTFSKTPNIEASIEINPNSLFSFEISKGYDIGINITGGGFLNYAVLPNGTMSLSGTYGINQGSSTLKIPGWPRKDFIITPGSSVKWNGTVDDPELGIETTSKVRGSYYNPVDGKNRQVNFIVYMRIANRLSQLEIKFDVLSEDQYVTTVLNTLSTDERMRQAINLLIFERIELPNMASSSDYVSQQISQFWESQLNQFTKSAVKGVDLSFGIDTYTGASEGGGEQTYTTFTYEVKKQMFNERGSVIVSGRMNDNSQAGAPTNNMLENFIFEYALDSQRINYLKVYRKQNYEDLLEGEVIKSGVGYIYRKNYNRLNEIWRRKNKKGPNTGKTADE